MSSSVEILRAGVMLFHGGTTPFRMSIPTWFTSSVESARDYGPKIDQFHTIVPLRLIRFDNYEEAAAALGVRGKDVSRALVRGIQAQGLDGYHYANQFMSSEEFMLLDPSHMVVSDAVKNPRRFLHFQNPTASRWIELIEKNGLPQPPGEPIDLRWIARGNDWWVKTEKGWYWLRDGRVWESAPYGP